VSGEYLIMVSDGSEAEPATGASWIVVDDTDCAIDGVPFTEGDTIEDGIQRLAWGERIPEGMHVIHRELIDPYPWQPEGYRYRWTVSA
jgi:hypothetical protein